MGYICKNHCQFEGVTLAIRRKSDSQNWGLCRLCRKYYFGKNRCKCCGCKLKKR